MAEPDFTNPELADVIKQEPEPEELVIKQEPEPVAGPSGLSNAQREMDEEEEGYSSQEDEMDDVPDLPMIPAHHMPKPETDIPLRDTPYADEDLDFGALVMDVRCAGDWPLSHLWPVYVGNFRSDSASQYKKTIRQFFASKGLLVHWVFQLVDDYFYQFQLKANLFDGLVYFGCEQDANSALECDHSICNGYTLNVFPGRDPVYFPADRSAMVRDMKSGIVYSEEFFARAMMRHGGVRCVVKFDIKNGAVEFFTVAQKQKMFNEERQFRPSPVGYQTLQKQRFVEANVQQQIRAALEQDPSALKLNTNDPIFKSLQAGNRPKPVQCQGPPPRRGAGGGQEQVYGNGGNWIRPVRRGPTKRMMETKLKNKLKKMRREIVRDLAQGKEPRSHYYKKKDKERFRQVYNQVMKEQKW